MVSIRNMLSSLNETRAFALVFLGQFMSTFGSRIVGFGMGVWVYQETGSKTQFGLTMLLRVLPYLILSFGAGVIVDRWDRRRILILSDLGAALGAAIVLALALIGQLQVWHIYLATLLHAIFDSIHSPAFNASVSLLVPKEHLGRANGIVNTGNSIGQLIGAALAGVLMVNFGLESLLLIDVVTCLIAVSLLLAVHIPRPVATDTTRQAKKKSLLREALYGLTYLKAIPGLFALFVFESVQSLLGQMARVLDRPYILDMTTADVLGIITSISAIGGIAGGLVMSVWGGPKRRIHGAVGGALFIGASGILGSLRPSVLAYTVSSILIVFFAPIQMSSSLALWQSKVAPEIQGRVFALIQSVNAFVIAIAYSTAGPLADTVFEPLLAPDGALADSVGRIIGVGTGRGVALCFICLAILLMLAAVISCLYPRLRLIEDEVPDAV